MPNFRGFKRHIVAYICDAPQFGRDWKLSVPQRDEFAEEAHDPLLEVVDEGVEQGYHEEGEDCACGEASDHGQSEADGCGFADAPAYCEGNSAENGSQGGHEYWAEAIESALYDCIVAIKSFFSELVYVIDDDDSVVDDNADHEDASDEGYGVH